ncbi:MAG: TIR domain-containing protein [Elusimicrobia bacterium]|nr:TIR domain-containing protein [Elusimicrobiota bacterium]
MPSPEPSLPTQTPRPAGDAALAVLRAVFPTLSPAALRRLRRSAKDVTQPADTTLCHEGEVEDAFYIIVDGMADVYKVTEGQKVFINHLGPGAQFGDLALLLDVPRTATIITSETTRLLVVDRAAFDELVKARPEIAVELSRMVLKRFLVQEEKRLLEIARLKKRDTPPPKVFVSYARVDEPFVTRLANGLIKQNIDVWLDRYRIEPAKSWARQIGEALDRCGVMLLVLSPASVASENVDDEWNYFLDTKRPVVVARLKACKVPYRLSKLQYVDFAGQDYDQALARVAATLNTL